MLSGPLSRLRSPLWLARPRRTASAVSSPQTARCSCMPQQDKLDDIHIKPEGTDRHAHPRPGHSVQRHRRLPPHLTKQGRLPHPSVVDVDVALSDGNNLYIGRRGSTAIVNGEDRDDMYVHDGKADLTTTRTNFRRGTQLDRARLRRRHRGIDRGQEQHHQRQPHAPQHLGRRPRRRLHVRRALDRLAAQRLAQRLAGPTRSQAASSSTSTASANNIIADDHRDDGFEMGTEAEGTNIVRSSSRRDAVGPARRRAVPRCGVGHRHARRRRRRRGQQRQAASSSSPEGRRGRRIIFPAPGSTTTLFSEFTSPGGSTS